MNICVIRSSQRKRWVERRQHSLRFFIIKKQKINFMYYSVFIDKLFLLCLQPRLCLLQRLGSYFIVFPWVAPNNRIFLSVVHHHVSIWHNTISISLEERQRHAYYPACSSGSGHCLCLKKRRCTPCMYFGLFIISTQTTNYANGTQKQAIQQISNGLFPVFFQASVVPFVYFW